MDFHGAKIALFYAGAVLAIQRDDIPTIPFPGQWDLPGGGREGAETPEACVLRELHEELGLSLSPARLEWRSVHPSGTAPDRVGLFFAARLTAPEIGTVRFGDEGQGWRMMAVEDFLDRPDAVSFLKPRLRACLAGLRL